MRFMRIGIDIDNTIICYDHVFAAVANSRGFCVQSSASKTEVKKWFHERDMHQAFTHLQGEVYGKFIDLANLFDGVLAFIEFAKKSGCHLFLVSHKTRYPLVGEKVDLHKSARNFLIDKNVISKSGVVGVPPNNVFFESTLNRKINRISTLNLDFFIDDLLQIFEHSDFPKTTNFVHFSQDLAKNVPNMKISTFPNWKLILGFLFCERQK
jgi:hypothetical protein